MMKEFFEVSVTVVVGAAVAVVALAGIAMLAMLLYLASGLITGTVFAALWWFAIYLGVVSYPINFAACWILGTFLAVVRGLFITTKSST